MPSCESDSERCGSKKGTRILSSRSIVAIAILFAFAGSLSVVVIHGGGFKGGSRAAGNMASLCSELASRGFVCVSIDYRMQGDDPESDGNTLMERSIRAAVQDAGKALDWMVNKAKELQVDAKRIAIGGGSAGAITSLLLTYSQGPRAERAPVAAVSELP